METIDELANISPFRLQVISILGIPNPTQVKMVASPTDRDILLEIINSFGTSGSIREVKIIE